MLTLLCAHRSEAKTVPNLLVAKSAPANQPKDMYSDYPQGYYSDGAYTAAPVPVTNGHTRTSEEDESDEDPQEAYYTSLRARFAALSSLLENPPPSDIDLSSSSQTAQRLSLGAKPAWRSVLNTTPTTGILGQLPQESVLLGLRMLESRLTSEQLLKKSCLSLWAWGLLARCRDAGQMVSEDIGILRDLGKKAVSVLRDLRIGMERGLATAEAQSQSSDQEIVSDAAKADEPDNELSSSDDDEHITRLLATLDMIITVVGEFYGQRDLLAGRIVWGELDMDCG